MDYVVTRNNPYAGGFTTAHYGQPGKNCHALQIEINRSLYMDEVKIERSDGFEPLKQGLENFLKSLTRINPRTLAA